ncbi:Cholinephosphotransferase 1 [Asimina triloba]
MQARKGSMLLALAMLYPFVVLMGGVLVWSYLSPSDIMRTQPHLVVVGTGFAFGFLVGRMILAHLCDEPKGLKTGMCMSLLYLPLAIANALSARLNDGVPLVDETLVLIGYCVFTVSLYMHFATSVVHEITTALGIYCFRYNRSCFIHIEDL